MKNIRPRSRRPSKLPENRSEGVEARGHESELQMIDDAVDNGIVGYEGHRFPDRLFRGGQGH